MGETEAQKRERITNTERDHSRNPVVFALPQLVPAQNPADDPIDAPWHVQLACPTKWFRPSVKSNRVVVVHCTAAENPASSTANFFASCSEPSGSTQGIVDNAEGFQSVPDDSVCAGAPPMNTTGLHVEQSGSESRTRDQWLAHIDEIDRLAFKTAQWCNKYGIPIKLLHVGDLPANPADAHGITYHQAISNKYHQSTHQDPGPGYPWDVFMAAVRKYAAPPKPPKPKLGVVVRTAEGKFSKRLTIWGATRLVRKELLASRDKVKAGNGPAIVMASLRLYEPGDSGGH